MEHKMPPTPDKHPRVNRLRRNRSTPFLRELVRETVLHPSDFVYPIFVTADRKARQEITSMPGQYRIGLDGVAKEAEALAERGVRSLLFFGIPESKDETGSHGYREDGVVQEAVRTVRKAVPDLFCITDVCVCEYTSHGHCGIVKDGVILNDESLDLLSRMAVSHAEAGAQMVAPSAMMDFQVSAIRQALDARGFSHIPILGYSAKMSSCFYGPFREAAGSAPQFGDRKAYQMDGANRREAMREIAADVAEGADMIMVKPGLAYLDIIRDAREHFDLPLAVYNVSGEYAMVKAAAAQGWLDERATVLEMMTAFRRAGADIIITYFAPEVIGWLR